MAIADSGPLSAAIAGAVDRHRLGTAVTTKMALGFATTALSIQCVPLLADFVGWRYAFLLLVPGPIVGAAAMRLLDADCRTTAHRLATRSRVTEGAS
jgi:MFS family permease